MLLLTHADKLLHHNENFPLTSKNFLLYHARRVKKNEKIKGNDQDDHTTLISHYHWLTQLALHLRNFCAVNQAGIVNVSALLRRFHH